MGLVCFDGGTERDGDAVGVKGVLGRENTEAEECYVVIHFQRGDLKAQGSQDMRGQQDGEGEVRRKERQEGTKVGRGKWGAEPQGP